MLLVACSQQGTSGTNDEKPIQDYEGNQLGTLFGDLPEDPTNVTVRDLSDAIGQKPGYNLNVLDKGSWKVIAVCADGTTVTPSTLMDVGIVRESVSTKVVSAAVKADRFMPLLHCKGQSHQFE